MRLTAIVLWLMILLVFVPIGGAHVVALLLERGQHAEIASVERAPGAKRVITR